MSTGPIFCRLLAFAVVSCLVAPSAGLSAQNAARENKISLLRPDHTLVRLPLEYATLKTKVKLLGYGGGKGFLELPGKQASVRLKAGDPQAFVMSLAVFGPTASYEMVTAQDPAYQFASLFKAEINPKRDTRQIVMVDTTSYPIAPKVKIADSRGIPLDFSRYEAGSVRIQPRQPLPPGEYCFAATVVGADPYADPNQRPYYCFGVDN